MNEKTIVENGILKKVPFDYKPGDSTKAAPESIDITDPDALRTLAKGALVEIVQTAPRNVALVGAIRELLDRIDGKAHQSIAMTVKKSPVETLSSDQLSALLALLPDPMIIHPMPKKLEDH